MSSRVRRPGSACALSFPVQLVSLRLTDQMIRRMHRVYVS